MNRASFAVALSWLCISTTALAQEVPAGASQVVRDLVNDHLVGFAPEVRQAATVISQSTVIQAAFSACQNSSEVPSRAILTLERAIRAETINIRHALGLSPLWANYRLYPADRDESCNRLFVFHTGCTDSTSVGDTELSITWAMDVRLTSSGSIALREQNILAEVIIDAGPAGVFRSDVGEGKIILNSDSPDARIRESADIFVYPNDPVAEVRR